MAVVGEVDGRPCVLVDDMIDTAGDGREGRERRSRSTAPARSTPRRPTACSRARPSSCLEEAPIQEVVVTNTVPIPEEKRFGKLKVLSIAPLIADALRAVFEDTSVSELFNGENQ